MRILFFSLARGGNAAVDFFQNIVLVINFQSM
jgi:hypothetical protein